MTLKAPFPYFGGKSIIASKVWSELGQPSHYIEPFFGSGAVLLARPNYNSQSHTETVNDKDGFVCNVWRALQSDPDGVARLCDWPVNHIDIEARRQKLIANERYLVDNLLADDKWFDSELAAYWIYGISSWIGGGFTTKTKLPHIGNSGMGVHAKESTPIYKWFAALQNRLRRVRVVCGDWTRVCGGNWQNKIGTVGMFFDPPYGDTDRADCYHVEDYGVAKDVSEWCVKRGELPDYRIVVCGYDSEHSILTEAGWRVERWKTAGGYGNQGNSRGKTNRYREVMWFSPHCIKTGLFD